LFRKEFLEGGLRRMKYTIPSLVYSYLKLSRHMKKCLDWAQNPTEEEVEDMDA